MESADKNYETKKQILVVDSMTEDTIAHFGDAGDLDTPQTGDHMQLSAGDFDDDEEKSVAIEKIVDMKTRYRVIDVTHDYSQVTMEADAGVATVYQIQTDIVSVEEQDS